VALPVTYRNLNKSLFVLYWYTPLRALLELLFALLIFTYIHAKNIPLCLNPPCQIAPHLFEDEAAVKVTSALEKLKQAILCSTRSDSIKVIARVRQFTSSMIALYLQQDMFHTVFRHLSVEGVWRV